MGETANIVLESADAVAKGLNQKEKGSLKKCVARDASGRANSPEKTNFMISNQCFFQLMLWKNYKNSGSTRLSRVAL